MPLSPEDIERQRLADYRSTFGTAEGKRVLADLEEKFLLQDARHHVAAGNSDGVIFMAGQAALIIAVKKWARPLSEKAPEPKYEQPLMQGDVYAG